jgi:HEAT repeat protein
MRRLVALCLGVSVLGLWLADPALAQKRKIDDLLKDLDNKTAQTRITALNEIGDLALVKLPHGQKALPQIRTILAKDTDANVRAAALGALGKIEAENKDYIANMMKYLKEDKDYGVQQRALQLLAGYQQEAAGAIKPLQERMLELREASKDKDPGNIRSGILNTLVAINQNLSDSSSMEALKEDKAPSVRLTAVNRLEQRAQQGGAKDAGPLLIQVYDESLKAGPSPELRRGILNALARIQPDPKDYLSLLTDTLKKDKDAGVVVAVIAALGRGGDSAKDAIPLVLEAQKNAMAAAPKDGTDPNGSRRIILESIVKLGIEQKELVTLLTNSLSKDRDGGVRAAAIAGLGEKGKGSKDAARAVLAVHKAGLTTGAKDGNDPNDLRKLTLESLAKMEADTKDLVTACMDSARRDKNVVVRTTAVRLLGEAGAAAKAAIPLLTSLEKVTKKSTDQDKIVAKAATEALEKIKAK